jgi:hypothetical protein
MNEIMKPNNDLNKTKAELLKLVVKVDDLWRMRGYKQEKFFSISFYKNTQTHH